MHLLVQDVQNKLCDRLINTGWFDKLRFFVRSSDFYDILLSLYMSREEGHRFTPAVKDILRPFELCHMNKIRVVLIHPEPYSNPLLNTGLAIESTDDTTTQHAAFIGAVGNASFVDMAKNGVLFLNQSLTTQILSPGRHKKVWEPFFATVFDLLKRQDATWLFIGPSKYYNLLDNQRKFLLPPLPSEWGQEWSVDQSLLKELLIKKQTFFGS